MRLAHKLSLVLVSGVVLVMGVRGYLRVNAEVALFERDMRQDHRSMARALLPPIALAWREDGEVRALALIEEANKNIAHVTLKWVWLDEGGGPAPALSRDRLVPLASGEVDQLTARGPRDLHSYVKMTVPGGRVGALEVTESLAQERAYLRASIARTATTTGAIIALCALVSWWLGVTLVGRPVTRMIEKARRVGAGEFDGPALGLKGKDELAELAQELDAMAARLGATTAAHKKTQEELRHADRLSTVGKLASGLAHELGTPLNVAAARARMIVTGRATHEGAVESAQVIVEECHRMTAIIRQLLDFARSSERARKSSVDLVGLARETVALMGPIGEKRQVRFEPSLPESAIHVSADRMQLQQVIANLVMNAIQAMPEGGPLIIGIERKGEAAHACLFVRDHGLGISEEARPHIFEPFFTTKEIGEGTGLGLSVAYGIVKEHGGWIDVDSQLNAGTKFSVFLPIEASPR